MYYTVLDEFSYHIFLGYLSPLFYQHFFAFYIPGSIVLKRLSLTFFQRVVLATTVGISLWAWQGFLFGYAHFRFLSYIYLLLCFLYWIKSNARNIAEFRAPNLKNVIKKIDPIFGVFITVGTLIQVSLIWFTGITSKQGIFLCCADNSADYYHFGLTYEITQRIPPFEPDMTGFFVSNYHYLSNLVVAELVRVFHLPILNTEFQFLSILICALLGLLGVVFGQLLKLKKTFIYWLLFFLYFGGDYIYILQLVFTHRIDLSMGPLENGTSFFANPPRAFAVVILFAVLNLLILWVKKKDIFLGILIAILAGSLVGFKVYIGIFALSGLSALGLWYVFKKEWKMILPIILAFICYLIIYLPVNYHAGGLFFTGFERFEEFIIQPKLGISDMAIAKSIYYSHGNFLRIAEYNLIFMTLFIFGIFGPKLVGIFQTRKSLSLFPVEINVFLLSAIGISAIAGFFFQQNAGGANSFNFLVSVYIIGSFYSALAVSYFTRKFTVPAIIFSVFIISTSLPRIIYQEYLNTTYIQSMRPMISAQEVEAMNYLKLHTPKEAVVFANGRNYAVFVAARETFLGDYSLLGSHTVDTSRREKVMNAILQKTNAQDLIKILRDNNISYMYIPSNAVVPGEKSMNYFKKVYENETVKILKIL